MKILLTSAVFYPGIGGVENIVQTLAQEFFRMGHEVTVVTTQAFSGRDVFPFQVIRQPGPLQLMKCYAQTDCVLQFGGVRLGWPTLWQRKPSLTVHQIWPRSSKTERTISRNLRRLWLSRSKHVCPSESLGKALETPFQVIPNPYDAGTFQLLPEVRRDRDLIFLGRLIPEKGADIFLEAVAASKRSGRDLNVTLVGDGPMRGQLEQQVKNLGLESNVHFLGSKKGAELAAILNAHKILVVPSRWLEPFGIVALEGIACGCAVIGSSGGGLPEAIGPCGVTFPSGDVAALVEKIQSLLSQPDQIKTCQSNAVPHLENHRPETVAKQYLKLLELN